MDCEGCEWKALYDMATHSPGLLSDLCTITIEIHVSTNLGMATAMDLYYFSFFGDHYIEEIGFRFSYIRMNGGGGEGYHK
jgi:hypothetical protein